MSSSVSQVKSFRFDINALRAIAVISVVLFHYKIPFFEGGFAGVDVFFVISGYLMSRIIFNSIGKGSFSLLDFYGKRVKRILPALIALIVVVNIVCFIVYLPFDFQVNLRNSLFSLLFLSNIYYLKHSGYFDPASASNSLLHTWSLSVEWQFYLLYPLFLLVINRFIKQKFGLLVAFVTITVVLFVISVYWTHANPSSSFYSFPSRSWEMMIGGIAFLTEDFVAGLRYKRLMAYVGYLLILLSTVFMRETMAWPGMMTAVPVLGTFLVVLANINNLWVIRTGAVQSLGKISYSLYLWHWPVLVIANYYGIDFTPLTIVYVTAVSISLAFLSYTFIESLSQFNNKAILATGVGMVLVLGGLAVTNGNKIIFKPQTIELANYHVSHEKELKKLFYDGSCFISVHQSLKNFNLKGCLAIDSASSNVLLIGDSHAAEIAAFLKKELKSHNINLLEATASGGLPINKSNGEVQHRQLMDHLFQNFLVNHHQQLKGVVLAVNWVKVPTDERAQFLKDLRSTISLFNKYGLNTIIIGQTECYKIAYSTIVAREYQFQTSLRKNYLVKDAEVMDKFMAQNFGGTYVDLYNYASVPPLSPKNDPYMSDRDHFSVYGARLAVRKIMANSVTRRFIKQVSQTK